MHLTGMVASHVNHCSLLDHKTHLAGVVASARLARVILEKRKFLKNDGNYCSVELTLFSFAAHLSRRFKWVVIMFNCFESEVQP